MTNEFKVKLERVRNLMIKEDLDGVLLATVQNYFWISCGKNGFVDKSSESATTKVLITKDRQYAICNSSEMYRTFEEELTDGSFELIGFQWHESEEAALQPYIKGKKIGCDKKLYGFRDITEEIQKLRYSLTDEEVERYREIGPECAGILEEAVRRIEPGETEFQAGARAAQLLMAKGYQVPVLLVGSDERLLKYRHPIPTAKEIHKCAMIAICGQKYGLTVSVSRIVSFVPLSEEIRKRYEAVVKIDATYILNTKAGIPANMILKKGYEVYASEGYEKDFHLHHQGGPLGYPTRDFCTNLQNDTPVAENQAYSWNPTIAGVKAEDTYIIHGVTQEIISYTGTWVYRDVTVEAGTIRRPDILVKEEYV